MFGTMAESSGPGLSNPGLNSGPRLVINGEWITWGSDRILWLPPEYRLAGRLGREDPHAAHVMAVVVIPLRLIDIC